MIMLELVYPSEYMPVIGPTDDAPSEELLPVVEQNGLVTAQAPRAVCHERGLLHPVVRLFVINRAGEFFLQKRSASKEVCPSLWDNAATGHVVFGESLAETLYRESAEEIGLWQYNPVRIGAYLCEAGGERELVALYAAVGSFVLNPHNDEVEEGRYWTEDQVTAALGTGVFTPGFEYDWRNFKDKALALL